MKKQLLILGTLLVSTLSFGQLSVGPDAQWIGPDTNTSDTYRDGNVAIGTNLFTDGSDTYKLSVNGKVRAESVKVYTTWADYVFEEDYNLPTLAEVKAHIKEKGHLIDIPSAKEVETQGIELGEMNKLLLQKIEELTLYILDQDEQIKILSKKVALIQNNKE